MQLITNAKQWYRLWSVWVAIAGAIFNAGTVGWAVFSTSINPITWGCVNMAFLMGAGVVRVIKQELPNMPPDEGPQ